MLKLESRDWNAILAPTYLCDLPTALTEAKCDPIMFSDVEYGYSGLSQFL